MAAILVIGAVALDRPIWLDRPVRPGGRLRARSLGGRIEARLGGGAANAGCALRAAGHEVLVATTLADDADGLQARALAAAAGLDLGLSKSRPGPSGRTLVLIDPAGERTILGLDPGPGLRPPIASPDERPAFRPDALLVRAAYPGASEWARRTAGPVLLHWPAPAYGGEADLVAASADDLPAAVAAAPYAAAAAELGPRLRWVVVTHGAAGAVAHGAKARIAVPAPPAVVRDATGAGDVFAAGLVDALVAGAEMEGALAHACAWGAAAVGIEGSAPAGAPPGAFRAYGEAEGSPARGEDLTEA